jgi:hypothetical protein
LGPRLTDYDVPSFETCAVEGGYRSFGFLIGTHFYEPEALRSPTEFISDDPSTQHGAVLSKMLLEPLFGHRVGKVSYIQLCSHMALLVAPGNATLFGIAYAKGRASNGLTSGSQCLGALFGKMTLTNGRKRT